VTTVVSDTSPIRALHHLNVLGVLHQLFGNVLVPPAVARELESPARAFQPVPVSSTPFVTVRAPRNLQRVLELSRLLDPGEAEAIALAQEVGADLLIIDELAGRNVAQHCGLNRTGALGVLVRAKQAHLITPVLPLVDRLRRDLNFHVSDELYEEVRRLVAE
jgi:uncharacterized protein